ncbi:inactive hydroxysteroid dehydrogenase-like protein 1 [Uranotaenia lowii]|uniref:inactive hydroxysteroid dehydrogenase-like protein 1 n=1 Tax=Uranotaenia lowii TaxID=190385 RepID=UPI0024788BEC|nr:inactive hydroxysteroid dehydrogenase-like protein 1 [Uranotaenia lowii]
MFTLEDIFYSRWLAVIGFYALLVYLIDVLISPCQIFWHTLTKGNIPLPERFGKWAVVTGGSDGIGKEYAINLAKAGMNVVLISRTESKLVQVAAEIKQNCPTVEVKILVIDFADGTVVYDKIREELQGLEVGILVNNAGMLHRTPVRHEQLTREEIEDTISVNSIPPVMLTHMLLPDMRSRKKGAIINVASGTAVFPLPFASTYSGSKAFLVSFTKALQQELIGTGVSCQIVLPMVVATNMTSKYHSIGLTRLISLDAPTYGKHAVKKIGKTDRTTGCAFHGLQMAFIRLFPTWLVTLTATMLMTLTRRVFKTKSS